MYVCMVEWEGEEGRGVVLVPYLLTYLLGFRKKEKEEEKK